jgi:hypothetical protein
MERWCEGVTLRQADLHGSGGEQRLRPAPSVCWCVDATGVTVLDRVARPRRLEYPDAVVWDCVTRSATVQEAARMVACVARIPPREASDLVRSRLQEWCEAGLIEGDAEDG